LANILFLYENATIFDKIIFIQCKPMKENCLNIQDMKMGLHAEL